MKNVLILNGHQYYPNIAEGKLTQFYIDTAEAFLQSKGFNVKHAKAESDYNALEEVEKFKWADFFIIQYSTQTEKYYKAKNKYYKVMDQKGNITIVNGMAAFCINNGLCKSSMSSVAKGKSRQYDGWQCRFIDDDTPFYPIEEITSRHKDGYVLLDYSGNKYLTDNLESFCQNHGISAGHLAAVAIGSEMHSKGWQCRYAGDNRDFYDLTSLRVRHSGKYKVKSPEGKEFIVSSLRGFSLKNGLHPAGMNDVCRGLYNQHRGWSVSYV